MCFWYQNWSNQFQNSYIKVVSHSKCIYLHVCTVELKKKQPTNLSKNALLWIRKRFDQCKKMEHINGNLKEYNDCHYYLMKQWKRVLIWGEVLYQYWTENNSEEKSGNDSDDNGTICMQPYNHWPSLQI